MTDFKFPKGHARGLKSFASTLPQLLSDDPAVQQEVMSFLECLAFKTDLKGVNLLETPKGVTQADLAKTLGGATEIDLVTDDDVDTGPDPEPEESLYEPHVSFLKCVMGYSQGAVLNERTLGATWEHNLTNVPQAEHETLDGLDLTAGTFTAPTEGVYLITLDAQIFWNWAYWPVQAIPDVTNPTELYWLGEIAVNGTQYAAFENATNTCFAATGNGTGPLRQFSLAYTVLLYLGDVVTFSIQQDNDMNYDADSFFQFGITLISDRFADPEEKLYP